MFGSNTIEIIIGTILAYTLVSSICTAVREGIESTLKTRAAYLERGIRELFQNDSNLISSFYNHPLINGLFSSAYTPQKLGSKPGWFDRGKNLPSNIPAKNFAKALMDLAARGTATDAANTGGGSPLITLASIRDDALMFSSRPGAWSFISWRTTSMVLQCGDTLRTPAFKVRLSKSKQTASEYPQPEKLLAVSDIEGEYDGFCRLLISAGVMDTRYRWTFGRGALVICGDLFDRGKQVNQEL